MCFESWHEKRDETGKRERGKGKEEREKGCSVDTPLPVSPTGSPIS
jgi:hypothetical protein